MNTFRQARRKLRLTRKALADFDRRRPASPYLLSQKDEETRVNLRVAVAEAQIAYNKAEAEYDPTEEIPIEADL